MKGLGQELRNLDWHILVLTLLLVGLGALFIRSATLVGAEFAHQGAVHLLSLPPALAVLALALVIPYIRFHRWAPWLFGVCLVMLLLLPIMGVSINYARRWLHLGVTSVQPSEFMKLGLVLALAWWFRSRPNPERLRDLAIPGLITLVPMFLIIKEPDLSSAMVLLPLLFGMSYVAGVRLRWLLMIILIGVVGFLLLYWFDLFKEYQLARIHAWLGQGHMDLPENQVLKQGAGYHLWQSLIAIGSGGLDGMGYMKGYQNTFDFLPYRSTDFIFSVIGEESGFIGCLALLLLYGLLVGLIYGIASRTRERFGRLLVTGIATLFATQLFMHTAVCTGLIPPTGLALPLISYGRSSLVTSFAAIGLALNVGMRRVHVLTADAY